MNKYIYQGKVRKRHCFYYYSTGKVENGLVHVVHTVSKDDLYYTQDEFNKLFKLLKNNAYV